MLQFWATKSLFFNLSSLWCKNLTLIYLRNTNVSLETRKGKKVALLVHPKCNWKVFEVEPSHQRQFLYSVKGKVVMTKCILKSHVLLLQKGKLLSSATQALKTKEASLGSQWNRGFVLNGMKQINLAASLYCSFPPIYVVWCVQWK